MRASPRLIAPTAVLVAIAVLAAMVLITRGQLGASGAGGGDEPLERTAHLVDHGPEIIDPVHPGSGFVHPGVLVTAAQLEFVRAQVIAEREPWSRAYDRLRKSPYAALSWAAKPREVVDCGYSSEPDHGCGDEWRDGVAAYTHALMWYLSGAPEHAAKAVEIIDAWSGVLRAHTNDNAPIQAGWSAVSFVRAAELLRHTYRDWPTERKDRAAAMFRDVFLPLVGAGGAPGTWGNWDLIILDAAVGIAVFLNDRAIFDGALAKWRARVPAYLYLASDGPRPVPPPGGRVGIVEFWFDQQRFVDGLAQETCRDLGHTAWGIGALSQVAETARIQGVDLYGEVQARLIAALEFHAAYAIGEPVPDWLCGGALKAEFRPIPELALNHYGTRLGVDLPRTEQFVGSQRPQRPTFLFSWETLTHAGNPH
jgi:hypothetical protein